MSFGKPPIRVSELKPNMKKLTERARHFARLVVCGETKTQAYRIAYNRKGNPNYIKVDACRLSQDPLVVAEMDRIRGKTEGKILLTLNDRLSILANIAKADKNRASDRTRAIDVYSRISGDEAPQRIDLSTPEGQPMQVQVQEIAPGLRMSPLAKMQALIKRRASLKTEAT